MAITGESPLILSTSGLSRLDKYSDLFHKHKINTDTIVNNPVVTAAELFPIIA